MEFPKDCNFACRLKQILKCFGGAGREYLSFKDVNAGLILTGFAKTKDALEYIQFCYDAFFPP